MPSPNQHRVPKAVEAITLRDSLPVGGQDSLPNVGGTVAVSLLTLGIMEVVMVLSKYIIEQYRKERDARMKAEGRARGQAEGREEMAQRWQDWNNRRLAAADRGEPFDEPPPAIIRED